MPNFLYHVIFQFPNDEDTILQIPYFVCHLNTFTHNYPNHSSYMPHTHYILHHIFNTFLTLYRHPMNLYFVFHTIHLLPLVCLCLSILLSISVSLTTTLLLHNLSFQFIVVIVYHITILVLTIHMYCIHLLYLLTIYNTSQP